MDGTNSAGRKVSLLNDHEPLVRLPSFTNSLPSPHSSYRCSPLTCSPIPQLVRSNSSDSTAMDSPSPITPSFSFDAGLGSPLYQQNGFYSQQKEGNGPFPHNSQSTGPLPYMAAHAVQPVFYPQHPTPEQHSTPSTAAAAAANGRPKKNSYPCPMAKAYNCGDYFTTSGHAARHAKKHTGKKDAFCPECNKAFTRKDNMEQHRRTHQSGRGSTKTGERDAKKAKHRAQRPKPSPLQSSAHTPLPMVDPSLPVSPATSFAAPVQPAESFIDYTQRTYPDPTAFALSHGYNGSASYGGLDALAIAASGESRTSDS